MSNEQLKLLTSDKKELMRSLSRLSFIGMGLTNNLDDELKALRKSVKSNKPVTQVKQHIDAISKLLLEIEESPSQNLSSGNIEVKQESQSIAEVIAKHQLPDQFKQALSSAPITLHSEEAINITQQVVKIIQEYFQSLPSSAQVQPDKPAKTSFWKALFGKKESSQNSQHSANINAAPAPEQQEIPETLIASLKQLIEQLSSVEHYREVADLLQEKISALDSVSELAEILELLTSAFINIANHEHQQLERFLKSLDKRIDQVNGFIFNTINYGNQVSQDSQMLNSTLASNVQDIRKHAEESTDIGQFREHLYSKLDATIMQVNHFYQAQLSNQEKLNSDIESLQEQLKATKDESSRLKDEFAEQRLRAQTDQLTQLPNRYMYNDRLTQEYNRWRRYRNPLSMVMADIDLFKQTNDTYGHQAGDQVLKTVALFIQKELRESDFIARYGGEEFIILLPETSLVHATKAMNKLRLGIKALEFEANGETFSTAMSFGIAEFENSDTPKAVFARADQALYRAKQKGRNQVCCQRAATEENN
ncbi:GGDEF domain-containing protein [Aliikangiella sp. IMCC44653]